MAQFTKYTSADVGAPVVSGGVGSLITLLDKCLVTGYGAKSAAGWTKPYTGTNTAVFKAGAGTGFYYRFDDGGPGAAGAKEARLRGYETMSSVDVGTGPFPTSGQMATGVFIRKSFTADSTIRDWKVWADSRTAYVFISTGDSAGTYLAFAIGDFYSYVTNDLYNAMVIARNTENTGTASTDKLDVWNTGFTGAGYYAARAYLGNPQGVNFCLAPDFVLIGTGSLGNCPYPNPADSSIRLARKDVCENSPQNCLRGFLRGLWQWGHTAITSVNDGDTFTGTDLLASRTFEIVKTSGNSTLYVIETSNTLDTN